MPKNEESLTVRVPKGWKPKLKEIAAKDERDTSYLTRKALLKAHPELLDPKRDHQER